jgi:hypothetical protein
MNLFWPHCLSSKISPPQCNCADLAISFCSCSGHVSAHRTTAGYRYKSDEPFLGNLATAISAMDTCLDHRRCRSRGCTYTASISSLSAQCLNRGPRDCGSGCPDTAPGRIWGIVNSAVFRNSEVLREFEITFDLKPDRIFLKKDSHHRLDPFRYTTIGIQFAQNNQGEYSVMSVWKNSPADEAGIKIGDQIEPRVHLSPALDSFACGRE